MYCFRTDLADERTNEVKTQTNSNKIDGIYTKTISYSDFINVCRVKVLDKKGSERIEKKIGNYITINVQRLEFVDNKELIQIIDVFYDELHSLLRNFKSILVVGLGNENTTADSIGPKVVENLEVTRHLIKYNPEILPPNVREISAISPGVLGSTGIETQEIIKSIVDKIRFDAIIVIDALSTSNMSRLLNTIQICDTGIVPGSGVSNKRKEISIDTMGIPVIAVGVPTVVNASTIVADTLDILADSFEEFNFIKNSTHHDKQKLIEKVLEPTNHDLTVMPKDVDILVDNMKEIIAAGINRISGL